MRDLVIKYSIYLCVLMFSFTSCVSEVDQQEEPGPQEPVGYVKMNLSIPAEKVSRAARSWGDPGDSGLQDELPRYLYLYIVIENNGKVTLQKYAEKGAEYIECKPEDWTQGTQGEEQVWTYKEITVPMSTLNPGPSSRIYAITSLQPLQLTEPTNQEELENLIFDQNLNTINPYFVYASASGDPANGAIIKNGSAMYTNIVCNHIVARVDIQWNIVPSKQKEYAMREIKLEGLPTQCYFFKPTASIPGEQLGTMGYRYFDVGNQWYGRVVAHVFDRKQVKCTYTLDAPATTYPEWPDPQPENTTKFVSQPKTYNNVTPPNQGSPSDAYTSWYRINVKFGY